MNKIWWFVAGADLGFSRGGGRIFKKISKILTTFFLGLSYRYCSSSSICLCMYNQPMVLTHYFYGMLKVIVSDDIENK